MIAVRVILDAWNIGQVDVTSHRHLVPAKHRSDGGIELHIVRFVDAARAHPEMTLSILPSLFRTELKLAVSILVFARALTKILERYLLLVRPPGM